jgi:hypothetical protein
LLCLVAAVLHGLRFFAVVPQHILYKRAVLVMAMALAIALLAGLLSLVQAVQAAVLIVVTLMAVAGLVGILVTAEVVLLQQAHPEAAEAAEAAEVERRAMNGAEVEVVVLGYWALVQAARAAHTAGQLAEVAEVAEVAVLVAERVVACVVAATMNLYPVEAELTVGALAVVRVFNITHQGVLSALFGPATLGHSHLRVPAIFDLG